MRVLVPLSSLQVVLFSFVCVINSVFRLTLCCRLTVNGLLMLVSGLLFCQGKGLRKVICVTRILAVNRQRIETVLGRIYYAQFLELLSLLCFFFS